MTPNKALDVVDASSGMIPDRLRTASLSMRPFASEDGPAVHAYWKSDPGWVRFNASVPCGFTESDANDFVVEMIDRNRKERPNWVMVHGDRVVGVVSLSFERDCSSASLGYGIHSDLRGRGLCVEAVEKVLDCAFSEYPELDEIQALTDRENTASIRVLMKLGFSEGSRRRDEGSMFCMSRSDWEVRHDV